MYNLTKLSKKVLVPGLIGNVIEWYDFALYGYFAGIISALFFPADDYFVSILITYSVFAVGLFMRPVGGIIFGYLGDRYGRKKSLLCSIILMSISTCLIGILPTYNQIGSVASIMLVICRLLQGIAVGGEFTCSMVYIIEHVEADRRGLYGSCVMLSAFIGLLLGSGVSTLVNFFSDDNTNLQWIWRIPFILGLLLLILGSYFRHAMLETPEFERFIKNNSLLKYNIKNIFNKKLIHATCLVILPSISFYLIFVYLVTYLKEFVHIPLSTSLFINTISMTLMIVFIPIFGFLSDRLGHKILIVSGTVGFIILSYPLFLLITTGILKLVLLSQCCFALLIAMIYSTIPATLFDMFDVSMRCTAVSIPYNIANSIFGGSAPLISTILIHYVGILGPSFYLIVVSLIVILTLYYIWNKEQKEIIL